MEQHRFEHIAAELHANAFGIATAIVSRREVAEDIAGETMLKLWTMHEDINDDTHAHNLMRMVVRRVAIDIMRRHKHEMSLFTDVPIADLPNGKLLEANTKPPDWQIEEDEDSVWLEERIRLLPDGEMQVMSMRQTEMRSNREIAAILGIKESSVSTILARARKKIFMQLKHRNKI